MWLLRLEDGSSRLLARLPLFKLPQQPRIRPVRLELFSHRLEQVALNWFRTRLESFGARLKLADLEIVAFPSHWVGARPPRFSTSPQQFQLHTYADLI